MNYCSLWPAVVKSLPGVQYMDPFPRNHALECPYFTCTPKNETYRTTTVENRSSSKLLNHRVGIHYQVSLSEMWEQLFPSVLVSHVLSAAYCFTWYVQMENAALLLCDNNICTCPFKSTSFFRCIRQSLLVDPRTNSSCELCTHFM